MNLVEPGEQINGPRDKALGEKNILRKTIGNNFLKVGYPLMKKFSLPVATFLSFLVKLEEHNENKCLSDKDGYFMIKREFVHTQMGLTRRQQEVICKELIELNLIDCKRKGHGGIGWVKLNHAMINLMLGNCTFDDADDL